MGELIERAGCPPWLRGELFCSRVEAVVDGFEAVLIDMRIDLGGGDIGMAEQFLNDPQVGTVAEKVGGKAVAKQMGIDIDFDSRVLGGVFDDLPDADRGEFCSTNREENFAPRARFDESGAFLFEISANGGAGFLADGDEASFLTFADDSNDPEIKIEEFEPSVDEFRNP